MEKYSSLYIAKYRDPARYGGSMRFILLASAAFLASAVPAHAQHQEANCPAAAEPLPAALSGWSARAPLAAATDKAGLGAAALTLGKGVDLALRPTPEVHYRVRPENPGGSVSHGGLAGFTVDRAGTYRVAIDSAAWIDVVQGDKLVESVAHDHGPACSGIRKMIDFALRSGAYVLQVAGNGTPAISVIVTRLP